MKPKFAFAISAKNIVEIVKASARKRPVFVKLQQLSPNKRMMAMPIVTRPVCVADGRLIFGQGSNDSFSLLFND